MLRFIENLHTSNCKLCRFQYIPCYGLSLLHWSAWSAERLFQYIPCYGLSKRLPRIVSPQWYFNTSHVTVYLFSFLPTAIRSTISIHPMLRFIWSRMPGLPRSWTISIHPMLRFIIVFHILSRRWHAISIHPMLRFIAFPKATQLIKSAFQYIPCYGLSMLISFVLNRARGFQYIPCYGLS